LAERPKACYNGGSIKKTEQKVPKTTKIAKPETKTETKAQEPLSDLKTFCENAGKTGTALNGRRIEFHFVRRKRKAY
jgi:hypothetical protein